MTTRPPSRAITEASFQRTVVEAAMRLGWMCHFLPDALYRRSFAVSRHGAAQGDKGWPDLVLAKPPRLIIAELKTDTGRVRPEQQAWLDALARVPGVEVVVWRPKQWEQVVATLTTNAEADAA